MGIMVWLHSESNGRILRTVIKILMFSAFEEWMSTRITLIVLGIMTTVASMDLKSGSGAEKL